MIAQMTSIPASTASRIASAVKGGWNEDHRRVRAGLLDSLFDGVEHRESFDGFTRFAWGNTADHFGAVLFTPLV